MNTTRVGILVTLIALVLSPALRAESMPPADLVSAAGTIAKEKHQLEVQAALRSFAEAPQLEHFFRNSYGCAIFPSIGKGGLGFGGAHGTGWVFEKNNLTGIVKMTQVTVGYQAGGQAFQQIVFFEDARAYKAFTSGSFEFAAQASVVALQAGAKASVSTEGGGGAGAGNSQSKTRYSDGMAVFTKAKGGLMYEATVGGQKNKFRPITK